MNASTAERRRLESLDPSELEKYQVARLNALVERLLPASEFYSSKLSVARTPIDSIDQMADWPFTFKDELHDPRLLGQSTANRTFPLDRYTRFHQTSGTRGRPLTVLDTPEDWQWWVDTWQYTLDAANLAQGDKVVMAFSYGPYIGFWSAHDAAIARGCLVIPGGGMRTLARLELIRGCRPAAVCCTPSYAMHLAETARQHQIDLGSLGVKSLVVAGEPGASIPALRAHLEEAWQACVIDHAGATEIGPWGYGYSDRPGLHVIESEFIAEFLSVVRGGPAADGELAELVLTSLGRIGSPVIRYRTGDLVRPMWHAEWPNRFVWLEGGILGRVDDMLIIRGVNIFPTAIEQILRSFPEVVEYRLIATREGAMDRLAVEIEDRLGQPMRVADELNMRLGLKVEVRGVELGSLPRFEGKGKRFVDQR